MKILVSLEVTICGLKFKNPVLPAAGPPTRDLKAIKEAVKGGAGGIVAKTVSVKPAEVPRPCMILHEKKSMLNTELWTDLPVEEWIENIYPECLKLGVPLIASEGYSADDIRELSPRLEKAGVQMLELSTHYLGHDPKPMVDAIKAAKKTTDIPVFPKLSPNILDIKEFAKAAVKAGADGIVAINSLGPCLRIDVETGYPLLGGSTGYGWISGQAIKPIALRCVYEIAQTVDVPVIGVGGIRKGLDAVEMIMAGASAVGICTQPILKGQNSFGKIARGIEKFMEDHDYETIEDFKGLAIKKSKDRKAFFTPLPPKIDKEKCIGCGKCVKHCIYGALSLNEDKKSVVNGKKCYGCGLCVTYCPVRAMEIPYWKRKN